MEAAIVLDNGLLANRHEQEVPLMNQHATVKARDSILLLARILLVLLFLIFGWSKLTGFQAAVQYMAHVGAPVPEFAAVIAVVMEFLVGIALALGIATRPLAILLAIYTMATAVIGHHYWTMTGMERYANEINFYKNVSITGGLLALYVAGAGRYAVDHWWRARRAGAG